MNQFDDTNRGALFKNLKKDSDKHPDYKGNLNVGGVDHWLSAWLRVSKDGKTYMSLSVEPKDAAPAKPNAPKRPARSQDDDTGDIPF